MSPKSERSTNDASTDTVAATRAAQGIRAQIVEGRILPGTPLREKTLTDQLDVSRNTLRIAMRLLAAEGLVVQSQYKGTSVKAFTAVEIRDIWTVRRTLELRALDAAVPGTNALGPIRQTVEAAEEMVTRGCWSDVTTASLRFHQGIVGLLDSTRLDEFFGTIVAQLRLAFAATTDLPQLSEEWVSKDREICDLLHAGHRTSAAVALATYLDEAEDMVLQLLTDRVLENGATTNSHT